MKDKNFGVTCVFAGGSTMWKATWKTTDLAAKLTIKLEFYLNLEIALGSCRFSEMG